jgi:hypothetical protein
MNVIAQYQVGKTSGDVVGCTSRYQRHGVAELPGETSDIFHTTTQNQDIILHLNQTGAKIFPGAFKYTNTVDSSLWRGQCSDFKSIQFPGKAARGGTGQPRTNRFCVGSAARSYKQTSVEIALSCHLRRLWEHLAVWFSSAQWDRAGRPIFKHLVASHT